jgi:hypothetical protein
MQAEAEWSLYEAANSKPEGGRVEVGDLEVIADVEVSIWHDHAANQRWDRGLAVERMLTMDHEACFNSLLAGLCRIQGGHELAHSHRRAAPIITTTANNVSMRLISALSLSKAELVSPALS